jgi:two-component system, OmpR family, sensor histidine kinase VanS
VAPDLGQLVEAWPFAASLALAARGRREARRRAALNEALHELRRPLQVLALAERRDGAAVEGEAGAPLRLAAAALERMDREINGEAAVPVRRPVAAGPLVAAAFRRWRRAAALAAGTLELRWRAGDVVIEGDEVELAQALDNLIANAVEHGGPRIAIEARVVGPVLRVGVRDSGPRRSPRPPRRRAGELAARVAGRRRHGHGLRVVRRVAAEHGGKFELRREGAATEAVLELPLPGRREDRR